ALEKEPRRRYETASQLSDDIDRYLNDEPIRASKPSAVYRLRKFVRRNRIPVVAGCFVFAALAAGIVGTSLGLREAKRQEGIARNEAIAKGTALLKADYALATVTEEKRKTAAALAAETKQRRKADAAFAEQVEQRKKLAVALETAKVALAESE